MGRYLVTYLGADDSADAPQLSKRVDGNGVSDARNSIVGYAVVKASSHAADHPHIGLSPSNAIEVMECPDLPGA